MKKKEYNQFKEDLLLLDELKSEQKNNLNKLLNRINGRRKIGRSLSVAAAMIAVSFLVFYGLNDRQQIAENPVEMESDTILRPTLIFDNGKKIELAGERSKLVAFDDSQVGDSLSVRGVPKYNTLIIPNQYTYNVVLEDGTEVFLNAGSQLRYPVEFNHSTREVYLEGEAYFKVAKSSKKFIVHTSAMNINVYGTEFNVNTRFEKTIETVLVEGSVGVTSDDRGFKMVPNELLTFNKETKNTSITKVNVANYLGWRNNSFLCMTQSLSKFLNDVSAWYGVKFVANQMLDNYIVNINISRDIELDELLEIIEEMLNIEFIKEGRNAYSIR